MKYTDVISIFESHKNEKNLARMNYAGIQFKKAYGIKTPFLRNLSKQIGRNNALALQLWKNDYHECKIIATMLANPYELKEKMMEEWVLQFYSWDICDQCIMNLFEKSKLAWEKAIEWSNREEEFVKRAGYVIMARLAVSDKKASNEQFTAFFSYLKEGCTDERNFVKKAVNWAIRQIGKRNIFLHTRVIELCYEIQTINSPSAKWIASDALRELNGESVKRRLKK